MAPWEMVGIQYAKKKIPSGVAFLGLVSPYCQTSPYLGWQVPLDSSVARQPRGCCSEASLQCSVQLLHKRCVCDAVALSTGSF